MKIYCRQCEKVFPTDAAPGSGETPCPGCGKSVPVPEHMPGPGCVIGDFLIEKALSKGGMGEVFLARQLSLDRPVALKVLQEKFLNDKEYMESLFREARAAGRLTHPNIVQAYAVGEDEGVVYFAMEFIKGETLKQILKREGKIDVERAAKIIREIASALDAAWREEKLVHQDIKPDNIMLDANGFAKLADLGLAKTSRDKDEEIGDEVLGTPQYISPEQLLGIPTDVRSDIYSLGATFFHFVTGRFAYVGKDGDEIARQHVEATLTPPKELNKEIPDAVNAIIVKMMAKEAKDRYQTPDVLVKALDSFLRGYRKSSSSTPAPPKILAAPPLLQKGKPLRAASVPPPAPRPVNSVSAPPPAPAPAEEKKPDTPPPAPAEEKKPDTPSPAPVEEKKPEELILASAAEKKAEEAAPAEEKNEASETGEQTGDDAPPKSRKKLILWIGVGVFGTLLLLGGAAAGAYFAAPRVAFLKPYAAWVDGVLAKMTHSSGAAQQTAVRPAPRPRPVKPATPPKPVIRTRQALVHEAQQLLAVSPRDEKFLASCDLFFQKYLVRLTVEEDRLYLQIRDVFAAADETLRMAPARERVRGPAEEKLRRLQNERREKQLAAEREKQEQEARRRAEAARLEEAKKADAVKLAQTNQEIKERRAVILREIQDLEKKILESIVPYAISGNRAELEKLLQAGADYRVPPGLRFPQEQSVVQNFQRFLRETPREAEAVRQFYFGLQKLNRNNSFTVLNNRKRLRITRITPTEIEAEDDNNGGKVKDPLTVSARNKLYQMLEKRFKLKNARFYLPLLQTGVKKDLQSVAPNGYWRNALQEYFRP